MASRTLLAGYVFTLKAEMDMLWVWSRLGERKVKEEAGKEKREMKGNTQREEKGGGKEGRGNREGVSGKGERGEKDEGSSLYFPS